MWRRLFLPLLVIALTSAAGCGGDDAALPPGGVVVRVGDAPPVQAEVADTPQERAVGLMRRSSVPRGTGMVFRYDAPSTGRYYMFDVEVPLLAVFASQGRVVGVIEMPPCPEAEAAACPTYGPDVPFDTVLETAPETLRGLVEAGDRLVVED
jgi:hypothetical protein